MSRSVRTLLFSTLFPSSVRPTHGIFVETRQRELMQRHPVETKVLAPVPWFPFRHDRFGNRALIARTPKREFRNGLEVWHPRYPLLPKVGMSSAPFLLAAASIAPIRQMMREGFDFDLIDAHYYYPDGVAAAWLARHFNKPLCITARGTDLNLIPQHALPRRMIDWAARRADASIGVCAALMEVLHAMGVSEDRLHVMRNGVDLQRFRPLDRKACRDELDLVDGPVLLSVGHLIERKGHHLVIEAMREVLQQYPKAQLVVAGEGEERPVLEALITRLGLKDHVRLVGAKPNMELLRWYSAADVLVLASSREGWANVLLEAMACGTPVVATRIWGTPEVVTNPEVGELVAERTPKALANGVLALLDRRPARTAVRAYAECYGWGATSDAQFGLFQRLSAPGELVTGTA